MKTGKKPTYVRVPGRTKKQWEEEIVLKHMREHPWQERYHPDIKDKGVLQDWSPASIQVGAIQDATGFHSAQVGAAIRRMCWRVRPRKVAVKQTFYWVVSEPKPRSKPKPIPKQELCQECGKRAWGGRLGSWRVQDKVWALAGYQPTDVACNRCFVKRLPPELQQQYAAMG